MTMKYRQAPSGWWQDAHGTMQPPGSYRTPALRRTSPAAGAGVRPGPEDTAERPRPPARAALFAGVAGRKGAGAS
jgi:hypothetical protein